MHTYMVRDAQHSLCRFAAGMAHAFSLFTGTWCAWQALVAGMVAEPDQPITSLCFVTDAGRQELLHTFNETCLAPTALLHPGQTIHGMLEHWAAATPDACAAQYEVSLALAPQKVALLNCRACSRPLPTGGSAQGASLTYVELDKRANQLAHHLIGLGVGPEVPVGVMIPRSLHLVVALLGVLKAGGAYVPLDPNYPPDRLAIMVEDSNVSYIQCCCLANNVCL